MFGFELCFNMPDLVWPPTLVSKSLQLKSRHGLASVFLSYTGENGSRFRSIRHLPVDGYLYAPGYLHKKH